MILVPVPRSHLDRTVAEGYTEQILDCNNQCTASAVTCLSSIDQTIDELLAHIICEEGEISNVSSQIPVSESPEPSPKKRKKVRKHYTNKPAHLTNLPHSLLTEKVEYMFAHVINSFDIKLLSGFLQNICVPNDNFKFLRRAYQNESDSISSSRYPAIEITGIEITYIFLAIWQQLGPDHVLRVGYHRERSQEQPSQIRIEVPFRSDATMFYEIYLGQFVNMITSMSADGSLSTHTILVNGESCTAVNKYHLSNKVYLGQLFNRAPKPFQFYISGKLGFTISKSCGKIKEIEMITHKPIWGPPEIPY
jgi:hypothetical protein